MSQGLDLSHRGAVAWSPRDTERPVGEGEGMPSLSRLLCRPRRNNAQRELVFEYEGSAS